MPSSWRGPVRVMDEDQAHYCSSPGSCCCCSWLAYIRGYPPFTSQSVQTCEKAIKERLGVPSTYQRIAVDESKATITFAEFFADPLRAVPESSRNVMVQTARVPPVQYVALIDYQAQDPIGAIIRERATCTFISLTGNDAPTRTYWV